MQRHGTPWCVVIEHFPLSKKIITGEHDILFMHEGSRISVYFRFTNAYVEYDTDELHRCEDGADINIDELPPNPERLVRYRY